MKGRERYEAVRGLVAALYDRNRQRGRAEWCGHDYDFVCPSMGTYPFQWFWDSCFHAVALAHFDAERARQEVRSLLRNAQPDGFVAHVTFWQREAFEEMLKTYSIAYRTPWLSDCMQPPVLAEAVKAASRGPAGREFLREVLPAVRRYFDWLSRVRDPDRDGLVATLQPDESGLDHTPKYDAYLGIESPDGRPTLEACTAAWERVASPYAECGRDPERMFALDRFVCEDVFVNTIYAENQRVLGELLDEAGDAAGAEEMRRRARTTTVALVEKCYDKEAGLFWDLAGLAERPLTVNTISSLLPLALPELPDAIVARLVAHLEDEREYATPFPVPTVARREKAYAPGVVGTKLVWRGPVWMNANWYLARGLRRHGRFDLARRIEDRSAELVLQHGFREYYDPETGEGHGARDFSWTGLVVDMLAPQAAEEDGRRRG